MGWSVHSAAVDLGLPAPLHCKACGGQGTVGLWLFYDYCTMAFVFGIVSRREYAMACSACGARREVPEHELQGRQTRPARIPFLRRYGLILVAGLPLAWVALYFIAEWWSLL